MSAFRTPDRSLPRLGESRNRSARYRDWLTSYLFLVPSGMGFLLFMLVPLIMSLVLSFTDWQMLSPNTRFVGFGNFIKVLGFSFTSEGIRANDPKFWYFLFNTIVFMIGIPLSMMGSLALALLVNQKLKGIVAFRIIFYLPSICNGIAIYILWRLMYQTDVGIVNQFLNIFLNPLGLSGPGWLTSTTWAKPALILMGVWVAAGGNSMIIYLAALQGIPVELYEAAHLDGANAWQRFRNVTWPMLAPATFFIFTMGIIGGFQGGFNAAYIMTGGGPAESTTTLAYYIFNLAYTGQLQMGYASAIAWILFLLIFVVTLFNWKFGGKNSF